MRKVIVVAITVPGNICPARVDGEVCAALIKGIENGAIPGDVGPIVISDYTDAPPVPVVPDEPEEVELSALAGFQVKGVRTVATMGELVAVLSQFPPAMVMQRTLNYEGGELFIDEPV